jgi:hypothetical protein
VRDGIYKNLALGRGWKSFLKSCERAKERGDTARTKAVRAVISELGVELNANFVHGLIVRARRGESLLPGFNGIDSELTPRDMGGTNSPFENDVLASAKRFEAQGVRGRAVVDNALNEGIENLKRRRVRHIAQHCLLNGGTRSKPVIDAVRQAISGIDNRSITDQLVQGQRPKLPKVRRDIDLDEDLKKVR